MKYINNIIDTIFYDRILIHVRPVIFGFELGIGLYSGRINGEGRLSGWLLDFDLYDDIGLCGFTAWIVAGVIWIKAPK